ncbi:MAG TPA: DUF4833 domain-containing protein [Thermoanaerobaculia bacterium]|jgi:hypothetical protein
MKARAALVLAGLLSAVPAGVRAAAPCADHLFTVERSKNANVVVYDAKRDASGELDPAGPVEEYWILNADQGQRQELSRVERERAYGVDVAPGLETKTFVLTFKAQKKRAFTVRMHDGCPEVLTRIHGHEAVLSRIYVKSKEGGLMPRVESIELFGHDAATGETVKEKFAP